MLAQIAQLLVDVVASFFVFLLLARFHFQWLRVSFRNPVGAFVVATTDWVARPSRRVIPSLAGLDLATLVAAWLVQALALWLLTVIHDPDAGSSSEALGRIAILALLDLVRYSVYILIFGVLVQVVLSWVNPYSPLAPLFQSMTRPFLAPIRRLVPPIANVDLSPLVLLLILQVVLIPLGYLRALAGAPG